MSLLGAVFCCDCCKRPSYDDAHGDASPDSMQRTNAAAKTAFEAPPVRGDDSGEGRELRERVNPDSSGAGKPSDVATDAGVRQRASRGDEAAAQID